VNLETLRDLLLHIMKNRTPATILCDPTGSIYWRYDVYGGCRLPDGNCISEIITVQRDFVVFDRTNKSKTQTRPTLTIIPISKIMELSVDHDFFKEQ
jgi:hypothetical protein